MTQFTFRYRGPVILPGDRDFGNSTTPFWRIRNTLVWFSDTYFHVCSYYRNVTDKRLSWELMKIEIRSATISFSKSKAKCISIWEQEIRRRLEQLDVIICNNFSSPTIDGILREYDRLKSELKSIYEEKGKQAIFRAKSRWIENGERPTRYFFNLEKLITTKNYQWNSNTRWLYHTQRQRF